MSLFANIKDIKIGKSNSGGLHVDCKTENIFYSILNGYFVYYCLTCKKWIKSNDIKDRRF